jgi:transposase
MIGVDPHKRSVTVEVLDGRENVLGSGRFTTDRGGWAQLMAFAKRWPQRTWAIEGCNGAGRPTAQRLVAAGETVRDVPTKRSAQVRIFATGNGRKTDAVDAHSVALVGLRTPGLRQVTVDDERVALKLLVDRRDDLVRSRTQVLNRLHLLLSQLIPGGAAQHLSATKAKALLASVRPRDVVGKTRRQLAADLIADLVTLDKKIKAIEVDIRAAVRETGSTLPELFGIGPNSAARILADVGDVARFPTKHHFASWTGTAPLDASSGEQIRHRLNRSGNRRLNHVLHIMAIVQLRHDTEGRAYYRRKLAAGKTPMEALRCLKRRLSDVVYRQLVADATKSPGGHVGATTRSCAADLIPMASTSEKPLPGLDAKPTPAAAAAS